MNTRNPSKAEWAFPLCPAPPTWALDWQGLEQRFTWLRALDGCPQDPTFHAEGDVLIHTALVAEALSTADEWRALGPLDRSILFAAALLHDVAKPACTEIAEDGRITSRGHARRGAQMARHILWLSDDDTLEPPPFAVREAIVGLVRYHGLPLWVLDGPDPRRSVIHASLIARCDRLAAVAEADARGRQCAESADLLVRIALFRELCREYGCSDCPYAFASDHSRFLYFQQSARDPTYRAYDDTRCTVILMSGLPGSGKDHWIATQRPDWPLVSLDALRAAMRIAPEADQRPIIAAAKELARQHLRVGQSFVWNATNTTRSVRQSLIAFFASYGARVQIIYLEAPWETLLQRNRSRTRPVPEKVIRRLAARLDVPDLTEAQCVEWIT